MPGAVLRVASVGALVAVTIVSNFAHAAGTSKSAAFEDVQNGFSLTIPPFWEQLPLGVDPYPRDLLAVRWASPAEEDCGDGSLRSLDKQISVTLKELERSFDATDRRSFDASSGSLKTSPALPTTCGAPDRVIQTIEFRDQGRSFRVLTVFGADATDEHRREVYDLLNSLQIRPAEELDRTPIRRGNQNGSAAPRGSEHAVQEVSVFVLNASGVPQADATMANRLRGLGYQISGIREVAMRRGSTVACVRAYGGDAKRLVDAVGVVQSEPKIVRLPASLPPIQDGLFNCLLALGI